MTEPFMGEIRLMSFNFPPKGWAECNGQFLPINQNQALFSLLGTMYGGNGQTTFALPDLRGRTSLHVGPSSTEGQKGGEEAHTLTLNELPTHTHQMSAFDGPADTAATATPPGPGVSLASAYAVPSGGGTIPVNRYTAAAPAAALAATEIATAGNSQAHENRQPFLVVNYCIALEGFFPSRN